MDYSFLKKGKRGRVYKGTLGRPKKKPLQEEGPTRELIQKRKDLYREGVENYLEQKDKVDVLSPLLGSSLGLLRLHGILSLQEYKTAEWFRGLVYQWRTFARSPSYVVSKFSLVLNKRKTYQREVLGENLLEEERQKQVEEIIYSLTALLQRESPVVWRTFNGVIIEDVLDRDIKTFLLKKAAQNVQRSEEQRAQYLITALKKGIFILEKIRIKYKRCTIDGVI